MPDRLTPAEFQELMEPWDEKMKAIARERLATNFTRPQLQQYTAQEAALMSAALARLIPQDEGVDLVGFLDATTGNPLGRGDRRPGMPEELELFRQGLQGLEEAAMQRHGRPFIELNGAEQDGILRAVRAKEVQGGAWDRVPPDLFFKQFYRKALHGYFAHPRAWMRIGFYGASYPEGYGWLQVGEVAQRHDRAGGWDRL